MKFKRLISSVLAGLMLISTLPVFDFAKAEEENDIYKNEVVENWNQYRDTGNGFWFVWNEYNYAYENLQMKMDDQSTYNKFITDIGYKLEGCDVTVDDCITYLSTIMMIEQKGMNENLASMGEYDVVKNVEDYAIDSFSALASVIGLKDVEGDLKLIQDEIGLAMDMKDVLLTEVDQIKGADMIARNYDSTNKMLNAVYYNATIPELVEAAGILLQLNSYTTLYYLDQFTTFGESVGKFGIDTFNLAFDSEFKDWLSDLGLIKASGLFEKFDGIWKKFSTYNEIALLTADIFVGNELRYMNEVTVLADVSSALVLAMGQTDPDEVEDVDDIYDRLVEYVPLLQALCVTRIRGEYATSRIACAHGSLLGVLIGDDKTSDEFYEKAYEVLSYEFSRIAEIFIVDDFVVVLDWNRTLEEIKSGSNVITEISADEPTFICKSLDDESVEAVNKTISDRIENWREYARKEFTGATYDGNYPNSGDLYISEIGRIDTSVMSFVYDSSMYYSGAVHPMHSTLIINFDTINAKELKLADILESDDKYDLIGDLLEEYKPTLNPVEFIDPKSSWDSGSASSPSCAWIFTNAGLEVIFAPGVIASYSQGTIKITVPYEKLEGILKEDYLKIPKRSEKGEELLLDTGKPEEESAAMILEKNAENEGSEHLTITSDEILYDVLIANVSYYSASNGTVYKGVPMFSLSTLSPNTIVDITTGKYTDNPNIYVEYTNGKGQKCVRIVGIGSDGEAKEINID